MKRLRPCYIAAPYGNPEPEQVARNVERATLLGRLALAYGYCPVVPHLLVPPLTGPESPDQPEVRRQALALGLELVRMVHSRDGLMWLLLNADGTRTAGVRAEEILWTELGALTCARHSWAELEGAMTLRGMADDWRRLR